MPRYTPVDYDPFATPAMAYLPVDYNPFEEMASRLAPAPQPMPEFTPGSREWYESRIYGTGIPVNAEKQNAEGAEFVASMAPVTGEVLSARDAWKASGRGAEALAAGKYSDAASNYLNMGTAILGAIPGAGVIARGTKRGAAWMDRNLPQGFNRLIDAISPSADEASRTTRIFAGPTARTADQQALAQAQELAASGASRDDIWKKTGWSQGVDGKWRFEIDDSGSRIVDPFESQAIADAHIAASIDAKGRTGIPQSALNNEVFRHAELEAAYSDIPSGGFLFDNMGNTRGKYNEVNDIVTLDSGASVINPGQQRSTALHELQHSVQGREGFGRGSSPARGADKEYVRDAAKTAYYKSVGGVGEAPLFWDDLNKDHQRAWMDQVKYDLYRRHAGEVEARNVQTRMNFTPEERRARAPWTTQDVPDDQQIVRQSGGNMLARSIGEATPTARKVNLVDDGFYDAAGEYPRYRIEVDGQALGHIVGRQSQSDPKVFNIEQITGKDKKHTFGTAQIRQVLRALQDRYPGIEWVQGIRESGARKMPGVAKQRIR